MASVEIFEDGQKHDLISCAGGVDDNHVVEFSAAIQAAQHAHNRCDPAAGADEQHLGWQWLGQRKHAFHFSEPHHLAGLNLSRVPAVLVELGNMRNAEEAAKLESPTYRRELADALAAGMVTFLRGP